MTALRKPILTGKRVILRPITIADAPAMHASLSDAESMRLTGTHETYSLDDVTDHCRLVELADNRVDYAIVVDGETIGETVLNDWHRANRSASFRIAIWYRRHRDRGYGSEATRLLIRFGFEQLGLNRIELEVFAFNPRARHVYEKAGFVHEGTRRQALWWDGRPIDAHVMAIVRGAV
ncbi:MAG: GNAT family protein [Pseudomonadota bacterium]